MTLVFAHTLFSTISNVRRKPRRLCRRFIYLFLFFHNCFDPSEMCLCDNRAPRVTPVLRMCADNGNRIVSQTHCRNPVCSFPISPAGPRTLCIMNADLSVNDLKTTLSPENVGVYRLLSTKIKSVPRRLLRIAQK